MKKHYLNFKKNSAKYLVLISLFSIILYGCEKDEKVEREKREILLGNRYYTEAGKGTSDILGAVVFDLGQNNKDYFHASLVLSLESNTKYIDSPQNGENVSFLKLSPKNYSYSIHYNRKLKNINSHSDDYQIMEYADKEGTLAIKAGKTLIIPIGISPSNRNVIR